MDFRFCQRTPVTGNTGLSEPLHQAIAVMHRIHRLPEASMLEGMQFTFPRQRPQWRIVPIGAADALTTRPCVQAVTIGTPCLGQRDDVSPHVAQPHARAHPAVSPGATGRRSSAAYRARHIIMERPTSRHTIVVTDS
jgi:hypothetical protein